MQRALRFAHLSAALLFGACTTVVPTDPTVLALPGSGKDLDRFNTDHDECRRHASARVGDGAGATWFDQQRRYDYAYIQCMYGKGHRVPVPGQFTNAPPGGPPPPPSKPEPMTKER